MEEFIYEERNYIKSKDLKFYTELLSKYEYYPSGIEDEFQCKIVLEYFISLIERAKDFIPAYQYAYEMLDSLKPTKDVLKQINDLEKKWFEASMRIAEKENIFNKEVAWGWHENRPLVRGIYMGAEKLWKNNEFEKAHELFSKILKTNENDNIGARYSVKATAEKMTYEEFEKQFTIKHKDGSSYYNNDALSKWFGKE
jgi:hypothetical protein